MYKVNQKVRTAKIRIGYIVLISGLLGALIALKLLERGL